MLVETGKETIFYASFENPEGENSVLVSRPTVKIFLGDRFISEEKMSREKNRFFLKKKIDLKPGTYLVSYSAVDVDETELRGEEILQVVEKNLEFALIRSQLKDFRKIYIQESRSLIEKLKSLTSGQFIIKKLLAALMPSEKIEEILRDEKP